MVRSNYLGKTFGNWKIVERIKGKTYGKYHENDCIHNSYSFVAKNLTTGYKLTLSSNALRSVRDGKTTIDLMFISPLSGGIKNPQIKEAKQLRKLYNALG